LKFPLYRKAKAGTAGRKEQMKLDHFRITNAISRQY
jgi:hypothetical protein